MKIYVCIKQVPDTTAKLNVKSDKTGIEENAFKWVMNPYDEFAVEEALLLKQKNPGAVVSVISLGPKTRVIESLRTALAMGADKASIIDCDYADANLTAKALAECINKEGGADIIFTGKVSIDDGQMAVTQMLAQNLNIPHANVVSKITFETAKCTVEREVDGGSKEVIELSLPCVIGANKGLNTPRYASLPGIMQAKKKPVQEYTLQDFSLNTSANKFSFQNFSSPADRSAVKMLAGDASVQVAELVKLLKDEAKVL